MEKIWNPTTNYLAEGQQIVVPDIGSTIVGKMIPSNDRPYQIFEVKNGVDQMQIINSEVIVEWAYISVLLARQNSSSAKLLSGFKEGANNDWAPTVDGYIQTDQDIIMLRQQINARLQTLPNEVDGFDGVDYINVIFGGTSVEQKAAALAEVIQNIPAVKGVTFINASWVDKEAGIFKFTFNVQSMFGDLQFQFGINSQNRTVNTENA